MKQLIVLFLILSMVIGVANAALIYNSIDSPLPGSYPSEGFEATQTDELGDNIIFAGTQRNLTTFEVVMTDWACENDFYLNGSVWVPNRTASQPCLTTAGSGFTHPLTLNIYAVDNSSGFPAIGALITTKTINAFIPFRPSYNSTYCDTETAPGYLTDTPFGGKWYDPISGGCVHGYNKIVLFDFTADNIVLPDQIIFGIAYNTADFGADPIGAAGPYNSLNYGLSTTTTTGVDPETDTVFQDSSTAGNYCDAGVNGTGTFRRDFGCWEGYVPTARVNAADPATVVQVVASVMGTGLFTLLTATTLLIGLYGYRKKRK